LSPMWPLRLTSSHINCSLLRGKRAWLAVHEWKEGEEEVINNSAYPVYVAGLRSQDDETLWKGRVCGLPKVWFFILAALLLLSLSPPQHWALSLGRDIRKACQSSGTNERGFRSSSGSSTSTSTSSSVSRSSPAPTPIAKLDITRRRNRSSVLLQRTAWDGRYRH
jgi:hypothetical protein